MTIRSIVVNGDRATIGAGGGITAVSDAHRETEETFLEVEPLLAALGASMPDPAR